MLFSAPKSFQPNEWLAENGCKGTKKWTKNQILFIFFVSNTNLHEFERRKPYSFHHNRFVTFILLLPVGWISFANLNKKVPFFIHHELSILFPCSNSFFPVRKFMFQALERTFRGLERTFHDLERTFHDLERIFQTLKRRFNYGGATFFMK